MLLAVARGPQNDAVAEAVDAVLRLHQHDVLRDRIGEPASENVRHAKLAVRHVVERAGRRADLPHVEEPRAVGGASGKVQMRDRRMRNADDPRRHDAEVVPRHDRSHPGELAVPFHVDRDHAIVGAEAVRALNVEFVTADGHRLVDEQHRRDDAGRGAVGDEEAVRHVRRATVANQHWNRPNVVAAEAGRDGPTGVRAVHVESSAPAPDSAVPALAISRRRTNCA